MDDSDSDSDDDGMMGLPGLPPGMNGLQVQQLIQQMMQMPEGEGGLDGAALPPNFADWLADLAQHGNAAMAGGAGGGAGAVPVDPGPPARVCGTACVLFEDNIRNVRAAKERFGMNTVFVAGATATDAELEKAARDPAVNLAVRTLADIEGQLDAFI